MRTRDVLITGAGSGIGRATALRVAKQGATVVIADLDHQAGEETVQEISRLGYDAYAFEVDVADPESVLQLRDIVSERGLSPTIIINNAGWDRTMPFVDTDSRFWDKVVKINYLGPVAICHAFLPTLIDGEHGGRIVNIASDAARVGSSGETVYAGAKGGVVAFSKSLAREVARYGITVNCVCPGPTETPLFQAQAEGLREALIRAIPMRRLGQAEEVAAAVDFFASDESGYITGQVISVSGGLTMAG